MNRKSTLLVLILTCNALSTVADDSGQDIEVSSETSEWFGDIESQITATGSLNESDRENICPDNAECSKLSGDCIRCDFDEQCLYGRQDTVTCRPKPFVACQGEQEFQKTFTCQYCYQTPRDHQICTVNTSCTVVTAPLEYYMANCTVEDDVICLGQRKFYRMQRCNWTSGRRWSTALILSITLGGFGADRFYLGHWKAGLGKLLSLGGLGVWTIVDVILVATGYVGPADGSLYIS